MSSESEKIFSNGDIYKGNLINGIKHGIGKCIFLSGDIYYGEWVNNMKQGKGK